MELLTFKKGVHPPHSKRLTESKNIQDYSPKGDMVFPMSQHIGAPCEPIVNKGDKVLIGQKIGEAKGFVSSPIYSSISGTVKAVELRPSLTGAKIISVIIENDNLYEELDYVKPNNYTELTRQQILQLIQEAGIVGMGGATFPTHVKLSPPADKKIDTIIINAAECEPYLTCDHRLMLEESEKIVEGLKIVLSLFPEAMGYIGIENNKMDAVEAMKKAVKGIANIEVKVLQTKFPQGAEKQLIYSIKKREVPTGKLPADVGCIVQNAATMAKIHDAVVLGKPLTSRIVTVTGEAVKNPKNLRVPLGTCLQELIDACEGFREEPVKVISGGPMMGIAITTLDIPVTKGTSGVLCLTKAQAVLPSAHPCIRCGKCVQACPMNLIPSALDSCSRNNSYDSFEANHGLDCIECGCCTFVCPAKRHLIQSIRTAKRTVLANKQKR